MWPPQWASPSGSSNTPTNVDNSISRLQSSLQDAFLWLLGFVSSLTRWIGQSFAEVKDRVSQLLLHVAPSLDALATQALQTITKGIDSSASALSSAVSAAGPAWQSSGTIARSAWARVAGEVTRWRRGAEVVWAQQLGSVERASLLGLLALIALCALLWVVLRGTSCKHRRERYHRLDDDVADDEENGGGTSHARKTESSHMRAPQAAVGAAVTAGTDPQVAAPPAAEPLPKGRGSGGAPAPASAAAPCAEAPAQRPASRAKSPRSARGSRPGSRTPPRKRDPAAGGGGFAVFQYVSGTPGPGWYDDDRETLSLRSARSHNTTASNGRASFLTSEPRDSAVLLETGDPGAYHLEAQQLAETSKRSHNRNAREGRGSFRALTPRGDGVDFVGAGVAPGCYDFQHLYGCGEAAASQQMTSSFRSALPLAGHVRYTDTPGVGEYDLQPVEGSTRSMSRAGSSMFAGGSSQHALHATEGDTTGVDVGPGKYKVERTDLYQKIVHTANPRLPGFNSTQRRGDPTTWNR